MKWASLVRYTVALVILSVWLFAVVVDARSEAYGVPIEVTFMAVVATSFLLGVDIVVAVIHALRRNGNGSGQ